MHPLDTLERLERNNEEARRIMQEHEQKQLDNERAVDGAAGYAD